MAKGPNDELVKRRNSKLCVMKPFNCDDNKVDEGLMAKGQIRLVFYVVDGRREGRTALIPMLGTKFINAAEYIKDLKDINIHDRTII